jgi:urease accessory protein
VTRNWLLWQLADSAFPTGGFAHSSGLEAAYQAGELEDVDSLRRFVRDAVVQAAHGGLPLVTPAYRDPSRLEALDAIADAFLVNAVANRASRVQGRALAATCARVWPEAAIQALDARARRLRGHHAPLLGALCRALGLTLDEAQRWFLYQALRGPIAAAVRLGAAGSYAAQQLQFECAALLDEVLGRCGSLDERDLAQTAPVLDLLQSAHDRLYSRLFQS